MSKIATNKWIKENLTPGYFNYEADANKCPSKNDINSVCSGLISIPTIYSGDQCVKETDLSIGSNIKSITFYFSNNTGSSGTQGGSIGHLDFYVIKPNGETLSKEEWNWDPSDKNGTHTKDLKLSFYGKGSKINIYFEKGNTGTNDWWYIDSTCDAVGGKFIPDNHLAYEYNVSSARGYKFLNDLKFVNGYTWKPNWEYDVWLSTITWFRLTMAD